MERKKSWRRKEVGVRVYAKLASESREASDRKKREISKFACIEVGELETRNDEVIDSNVCESNGSL